MASEGLLIVMMAGLPVGVLVLLDIVMVIRFGWSSSAFYPPSLRYFDVIMSMLLSKPEKPVDD